MENIEIIFTEEQIQDRIKELANELYKDYDGEYQIKVRKSEKLLRNWKNFFQDNKKYFI